MIHNDVLVAGHSYYSTNDLLEIIDYAIRWTMKIRRRYSCSNSLSKSEWWKTFFQRDYLKTYNFSAQRTKKEIAFLIKTLDLDEDSAILDLCCGTGRHSIELARRGFNITGFDLSPVLLREAARAAKSAHVAIKFVRGDMHRINFNTKFDIILNLFSSFGYFNDQDNETVIAGIAKALKKDGRLFIDILNRDHVVDNLNKQPHRRKIDGGYLLQTARYESSSGILTETRTLVTGGKRRTYKIMLRLYSYSELSKLMQRHSLVPLCKFGGYDGSDYSRTSTRMLVIAKKR